MELVGNSVITGVVVHARGALVSRRVQLDGHVPDGDVDVALGGITPLLEGASVRASLRSSKRTVVSVQSSLEVPNTQARASVSVERLQEIESRLERLRAEVARLERRRSRLIELRPSPRLGRSRRDGLEVRFADALAFGALVGEVVESSDGRLIELRLQIEKVALEYQAASLEHAQLTSSEKQGTGHPMRRIVVRLGGAGEVGELEVVYAVPAARWWPLYTLRLTEGGQRAALALEALVAQRTGEDWTSVPLALSTADLLFDAQLPELPSLHLGRAQPPKRPSYRAPPEGLDRLFVGYDLAFARPPPAPPPAARPKPLPAPMAPPMPMSLPPPPPAAAGPSFDAASSASFSVPQSAPRGGGEAMKTRARAPPMARRASAPMKKSAETAHLGGPPDDLEAEMSASAEEGGGGAPQQDEPDLEPSTGWLDFAGLRLAAADSPSRRGRLVPGSDSAAGDRARAASQIESLDVRQGLRDPLESRGQFDYRYDLRGQADVPSDGLAHRLLLATGDGVPAVRFRSVPHGDAQVFREAALTNPFDSPLLAGPVEVYVEGSLLTTSALERVDKGGALTVGMGVEERVKVARNVRAEEENAGLLGGSTAVTHTVSIDLTSSLASPAELELVDRLPVTDEKGVEVKLLSSSPEATPYKQEDRGQPLRGGLRWKLTLAPGEKKHLELKYRISFNAKDELIGGNRRD